MSTEGYYHADEIPAGSRVRDPNRGNHPPNELGPGPDEAPELFGVVTHVTEETPHTVRVHWESGESCVHPNGAKFQRG